MNTAAVNADRTHSEAFARAKQIAAAMQAGQKANPLLSNPTARVHITQQVGKAEFDAQSSYDERVRKDGVVVSMYLEDPRAEVRDIGEGHVNAELIFSVVCLFGEDDVVGYAGGFIVLSDTGREPLKLSPIQLGAVCTLAKEIAKEYE